MKNTLFFIDGSIDVWIQVEFTASRETLLPIGGLMTNQTAEEVAEIIEHLIITARDKFNLSHEFHPLMTLVFMTLPVIPALKLTSNGLFDVKQFKLVDVSI